MTIDHWEPINSISTSHGSAVFFISLLGTAFSDLTVEEFELSFLGDECPVMLLETEWCFPIDWEGFIASIPSIG